MSKQQLFKEKGVKSKARYRVAYTCPVDGETVIERVQDKNKIKVADIYTCLSISAFNKGYENE